jgi:uncharacterized protein (TIGR02452 family)
MSVFEPRIPRHLAVQLGEEAVAISQAGRYVGPAGPAEIGAQVTASLKKTAYYGPDHPHGSPAKGPHPTRFEVTNETTLSAHRRHQAKGHNVVSLNFASATSPGGGFLTGARAQEEYLCRSSALYLTLKDWPMYGHHRTKGGCLYSDAMIYSPEVPVFRDDAHELLAAPYEASFITSAAPLAKHASPAEFSQLPKVLRDRIYKILAVAQYHGHDSLVLGAWGCGAFGNDGHQVAELFHRALTVDFAGAFREVTFAIVDTSPERKFIGPFAQRFTAPAEPGEEVVIKPLWEIVGQLVVGRANDEWRLVHSTNPQVAHFLQMGMRGTNMKCLFIPKKGDKEGTGQVILNVGPNDLKTLLEYAEAHPESLRVPTTKVQINFDGNGDTSGEPIRWENGGAVYAHAHLVSPAGPELYGRLGPWYADALEGIWDFIGQAARWHQDRKQQAP